MLAIFKREFKAYFTSFIAYVFIGVFLIFAGISFIYNLNSRTADMSGLFGVLNVLSMFVIPLLTMRLLCEDRRAKTDQILLTSPVSVADIILGKYFAAFAMFMLVVVVTFIYPIVLSVMGQPDMGIIFTNYVGYILLCSTFLAIGTLVSSLTENQFICAIVTIATLFCLMLIGSMTAAIPNPTVAKIVSEIAIMNKYTSFQQGFIDVTAIMYYITATGLFLFLTARVVEKRRWS